MAKVRAFYLFIALLTNNCAVANNNRIGGSSNSITKSLEKALNFVNDFYYEINLDGAIGVAMAEAHLLQALEGAQNSKTASVVMELIRKCRVIQKMLISLSHSSSSEEKKFLDVFLNPQFWKRNISFAANSLDDLGYYENWTKEDILRNRSVSYAGVQSNECLIDALDAVQYELDQQKSHYCPVSARCQLLMFGHRADGGYLLTHRLFYLQIRKLLNCRADGKILERQVKKYCSQILKEAKTNEYYNYPYHDIFLEQVLFCGVEGFEEFLTERWTREIIRWQRAEGCYEGNAILNREQKRSSNVIHYGCTDHATGLAIAALALNLRYMLRPQQMS